MPGWCAKVSYASFCGSLCQCFISRLFGPPPFWVEVGAGGLHGPSCSPGLGCRGGCPGLTPQEHCVACISVKINRLWGSLHIPSLSLLECVHSRICSFTQHIFTECFPFARPWVHGSEQSSQQPVLLELASRGEAVHTETNRCIKQGRAGTRAFEGCWRRGLDGVRVPGPGSIQISDSRSKHQAGCLPGQAGNRGSVSFLGLQPDAASEMQVGMDGGVSAWLLAE